MRKQVVDHAGWNSVLRKLGVPLLVLAVLAAFAWALRALHLTDALLGFVSDIRGSAWGVPAFSGIYILATVLMLPASLLTLAAGFLYGPLWGTALVSPVSVVAAVAAFWVGRTVARRWVERRIAVNPKLAAIDQAVEAQGLKLIILLRLSPVLPFNFLNYALSLTRVRFRDYLLGSVIGMLPGTFLYVYLGSLATSVAELAHGKRQAGAAGHALYWGGLVATAIVTVLVTRSSRRALKKALERHQPTSGHQEQAT